MNAAHLHLLVVHLPVVGCPVALLLMLVALRRGDDALLRLAWLFLIATAVLAVVAYYSGPPAYELLATELEPVKQLVEDHAVVARAAFVGMVVAAALAVQGWLQFLQQETPPRWLRWTIAALTLLLCYLLAWSAHLGGALRHPEVRDALGIFPGL